jgi:hypothetical protein
MLNILFAIPFRILGILFQTLRLLLFCVGQTCLTAQNQYNICLTCTEGVRLKLLFGVLGTDGQSFSDCFFNLAY